MNEQENRSIGSPCPLGPMHGIWSLIFKIVLVMTLLTIPIVTVSTTALLHRIYATKTTEHHQLLTEYNTNQREIMAKLENIKEIIDNLPIKEWQKTTERLNSKDHAEIKTKIEQLIRAHTNE